MPYPLTCILQVASYLTLMASQIPRSGCPIASSLDIIGDRWTLVVLRDLLNGKSRFGEFLASPEGIATNVLTVVVPAGNPAGVASFRELAEPGVQVVDDPANKIFPVPLDTTGKDDCLVGRIRKNIVLDNALDLWVVGDQVRKGAALNAVQIAEIL